MCNYKTYLIYFLSLTDHCLALLDILRLKTIVSYILFNFLDVLGMRVNQVPVSPSLPEAEVYEIYVIIQRR